MLPYPNISPEIFSLGPISVRWYGLMYVIAYVLGFLLVRGRVKQGLMKVPPQAAESFITYMIVGMLLGARLLFVFVYDFERYRSHIWEALYIWQGGLSFHGAALGMIVASALFARRYKTSFYSATDTLAFCAAPGLFFGRMGNFINAELYGRVSDVPWAMVFPSDPTRLPRHPSQLYQGLTEGLLLALILWLYQKRLLSAHRYRDGLVGAAFLVGYGVLRFFVEFTREPDPQLGLVLGPFSMGQLLCAIMVAAGIGVFIHVQRSSPLRDIQKA